MGMGGSERADKAGTAPRVPVSVHVPVIRWGRREGASPGDPEEGEGRGMEGDGDDDDEEEEEVLAAGTETERVWKENEAAKALEAAADGNGERYGLCWCCCLFC